MTEREAEAIMRAELVSYWSRVGLVLVLVITLAIIFRRRIVAAADRFIERVDV